MSVLRISPEFRPAYAPLLRMATALSRVDVDTAALSAHRTAARAAFTAGGSAGFARSFRRIAMNRFGANLRARPAIHSSSVELV
jgi:hypothetical protein